VLREDFAATLDMGGSSSSPQPTAFAQEEGNVVTISEDVARRILGRQELIAAGHRSRDATEETDRPVTYRAQSTTSEEDRDLLEAHYRRRSRSLEHQNAQLQKSNEEDIASVVKEFESKFLKQQVGCVAVCAELQQAVERCYAAHPGSTLACSAHVRALQDCVRQHRQAMFATKG
jgi:isochorismate hydrolase